MFYHTFNPNDFSYFCPYFKIFFGSTGDVIHPNQFTERPISRGLRTFLLSFAGDRTEGDVVGINKSNLVENRVYIADTICRKNILYLFHHNPV